MFNLSNENLPGPSTGAFFNPTTETESIQCVTCTKATQDPLIILEGSLISALTLGFCHAKNGKLPLFLHTLTIGSPVCKECDEFIRKLNAFPLIAKGGTGKKHLLRLLALPEKSMRFLIELSEQIKSEPMLREILAEHVQNLLGIPSTLPTNQNLPAVSTLPNPILPTSNASKNFPTNLLPINARFFSNLPMPLTSNLTFGTSTNFLQKYGTTYPCFIPKFGSDTTMKNGISVPITTRFQCVSAITQYEGFSFEELRLFDYQANLIQRNYFLPQAGNSISSGNRTPFQIAIIGSNFGQGDSGTLNGSGSSLGNPDQSMDTMDRPGSALQDLPQKDLVVESNVESGISNSFDEEIRRIPPVENLYFPQEVSSSRETTTEESLENLENLSSVLSLDDQSTSAEGSWEEKDEMANDATNDSKTSDV